jgi:hypothetical protein
LRSRGSDVIFGSPSGVIAYGSSLSSLGVRLIQLILRLFYSGFRSFSPSRLGAVGTCFILSCPREVRVIWSHDDLLVTRQNEWRAERQRANPSRSARQRRASMPPAEKATMYRLAKRFSAVPFPRVDGWSKTDRGRAEPLRRFSI